MKNWWYYHKWYVVCGIILFGIACDLVGNALGLFREKPDYQIAYIGKSKLPQDTVAALEQAFASVSGDFNGDGKVIVQVNQYLNGSKGADPDTAIYEYAYEVALIGDISDCESYFFLMDDPNSFQREFHILAAPDGSCPDEMDYSVDGKVVPWPELSVFSELELGAYSDTALGQTAIGKNQDVLSGLWFGRRCFYMEETADNSEKCSSLWEMLINPRK